MRNESVSSDSVRIPEPHEGVATLVSRGGKSHAVVVHPSDYERFAALDALLADCSKPSARLLSDAARAAHIESVTPGRPEIGADRLRNLFE